MASEHGPGADPELLAMEAIIRALAPIDKGPDNGAIERVLRWACDRWCVEAPRA